MNLDVAVAGEASNVYQDGECSGIAEAAGRPEKICLCHMHGENLRRRGMQGVLDRISSLGDMACTTGPRDLV